jgi:hypothetical protein
VVNQAVTELGILYNVELISSQQTFGAIKEKIIKIFHELGELNNWDNLKRTTERGYT